MNIASLVKFAAQHKQDYEQAQANLKRTEREYTNAKEELETATVGHATLLELAQTFQENAHKQVAAIVQAALNTVFEEPYQFRIQFTSKAGKTQAKLLFMRDGSEVDPLEEAGGGVVDIAAFALRLSAIVLRKEKVRRLMVLDEPFRFVSAKHRPQVKQLLEQLASQFDFQFIYVTHMKEIATGTVHVIE